MPEATFFASSGEFRAWLAEHHESGEAVVVGFHRKATGAPSMTWQESVDVALCFGWIDGTVRRIDDDRYSRRFTPRKPRSIWSAVNVRRFGELAEAGLVQPAGYRAFERRTEERSGVYSHERGTDAVLEAHEEARFRAVAAAWERFSARPPSYRRAALHWIVSAKRPETRERRLARLIEDSASGATIPPLRWGKGARQD